MCDPSWTDLDHGWMARQVQCAEGTDENSRGIHPPETSTDQTFARPEGTAEEEIERPFRTHQTIFGCSAFPGLERPG